MAPRWTILAVLDWTAAKLAERGAESARLEAELLLGRALGVSRVELYTSLDKPLIETELARTRTLVRARIEGEPIAYLIGEREFWSLPIQVDHRVLIPRPDTEVLVEVALTRAREPGVVVHRIADVGTGSGAVALALAGELRSAHLWAIDISSDALDVAAANARRLGLADRVSFARGDLFGTLTETFNVIVSNPPYVASGDVARLAPDVRREPRLALDGGRDGLDLIRRLVPASCGRLAPGGWLVVEHGWDQGPAVRELFLQAGLVAVATQRDLGGRERVTSGRTSPRPGI